MARGTATVEAPLPTEESSELFDTEPYRRPTPDADGRTADKLRVTFSGSIELDAMNARDVLVLERLRYGRSVQLGPVSATVAGKTHKLARANEAGDEPSTYTVALRVDTVNLEELATELGVNLDDLDA